MANGLKVCLGIFFFYSLSQYSAHLNPYSFTSLKRSLLDDRCFHLLKRAANAAISLSLTLLHHRVSHLVATEIVQPHPQNL